MQRALIRCFVLALLIPAACGVQTLVSASKYVKTQSIDATQGGTIAVSAADSQSLAGTQIVIPPGALGSTTVITVGAGSASFVPAGGRSAGPIVDLGPNGLQFKLPVTVTLPFALPSGSALSELVVEALESNGNRYQIATGGLLISGSLVSFSVNGFTQFQADVVPPPPVDAGCTNGQTLCQPDDPDGGYCADTSSDNQNCGGCGYACPVATTSCVSGACSCLLTSCPAPDGTVVCTDTTTDPLNCGGCALGGGGGATCASGETCVTGQCTCGSGTTICNTLNSDGTPDGGTYCADITTDPLNCGACSSGCAANQKCEAAGGTGQCVCDASVDGGADLMQCAVGCIHTGADPRNCGACNLQCDTGICNGGICACDPDAGIMQCTPTTCTNISRDVTNCGACGIDCTQGGTLNFADIVCISGICRCQGGQDAICPDIATFPALACVDTSSDPNNCGGCGLLADGGGPDGGGLPSPFVCSDVRSACANYACVCPSAMLYCAPGTWTAASGDNDAGVCLNQTADSLNCGSCGNVCPNSEVCTFSTCQVNGGGDAG